MASDGQALGVTPPLSTALPTDSEKLANESLVEELRRENNFESASETEHRQQVLKTLESIGNEFVRRVAAEKEGHNERLVKDAICRVFTYGSYRLGVHGPGSDIDTLVVGPKYVSVEDFFRFMPPALRELSAPGALESIAEVPDAFVPIIKMVYSGIEIDLIFSRIASLTQLPSDPSWNLTDNNLLRGLEENEVRSVNGTRVSDEMISLVPEPSTFRIALRAIKLWGQRRAVYGNIVGFPGGIAWALMVARVCQLYPKASSSVIVAKFFSIMLLWPWPQPVTLKTIETGRLQVTVWNPKGNKRDGLALMPVITPAYPSMNSTFNISQSSKAVIEKELRRAGLIAGNVMDGKAPWRDLFTKHSFFTKDYKHYLAVNSLAMSKEHIKIWSGWVESRLRTLIQALEKHDSIELAHAFIKGYPRKHRCSLQAQVREIQDGSMAYLVENDTESEDEGKTDGKTEPTLEAKQEPDTGTGEPEAKLEPGLKQDIKQAEDEADLISNLNDISTANTDGVDEKVKVEEVSAEVNGVEEKKKATTIDVFTKTFYIGLQFVDSVEARRSMDLAYQVNFFTRKCTEWEKYKTELSSKCSVATRIVRNIHLPDDVFEAGEVKPTKAKKNGTGGKRVAVDNPAPPAKRQQKSEGVAAAG